MIFFVYTFLKVCSLKADKWRIFQTSLVNIQFDIRPFKFNRVKEDCAVADRLSLLYLAHILLSWHPGRAAVWTLSDILWSLGNSQVPSRILSMPVMILTVCRLSPTGVGTARKLCRWSFLWGFSVVGRGWESGGEKYHCPLLSRDFEAALLWGMCACDQVLI